MVVLNATQQCSRLTRLIWECRIAPAVNDNVSGPEVDLNVLSAVMKRTPGG